MSVSESPVGAERPEEIRAVPVRRPGRWIAAVIVLVVGASLIRGVITNPHFEWHVIGSYLFDSRILSGMVLTIELTIASMAIGIALGVMLAVMRLSPNPIVSGASWLYIWFFRGTPLLVQILFWYNIAALFPVISLGIPFGPAIIHGSANTVVTAFVAGLLALSFNEGAYMSEIVRAGIISVAEGQTEAAQSLGLSRIQTLRLIVLPQAMRVAIPPTGNETISMLKNTSLVSVIALAELTYSAQQIYNVSFKVIPLLIVISIWYLVLTSVLYVGQYFIERRYGRGFSRAERATLGSRWLAFGHRGSGEAGNP
ncbi:MAG TPA: amino acid ABC transporter permease [Candidatus Dormibacteraeota bacterium]|nr:amino acid ABC transporter permease [Candidatus Dormibacteraeota bacterium]